MSGSGRGDVEWQQQARNLVLLMLEACGRDADMKRRVLDHLETVVRDVQLMVEQASGATRASGAGIRPFYDLQKKIEMCHTIVMVPEAL
jgi:hypothetical protein